MKHKIGDVVTIKSKEWYSKNKDKFGNVECGHVYFVRGMSKYCGVIAVIKDVDKGDELYSIDIDGYAYFWTDEMFEDAKDVTNEE